MSQSAFASVDDIKNNDKVKKEAAYTTLRYCTDIYGGSATVRKINGMDRIKDFGDLMIDDNLPLIWNNLIDTGRTDRTFDLYIDKTGGVTSDEGYGVRCEKEAFFAAFTNLGKSISASSSDEEKIQFLCDLGYVQTALSANTPAKCLKTAGTQRGSTDTMEFSSKKWSLPGGHMDASASDFAGAYLSYRQGNENIDLGDGNYCWADVPSDGTIPAGFSSSTIYVTEYSGGQMIVKQKLIRDGTSYMGSGICSDAELYFSASVSGSSVTLNKYAQAFATLTGAKVALAGSSDDTSDNAGDSTSDSAGDSASCDLGVMGWIICPAIDILGGLTDLIMSLIETQMEFTAYLSSDTGDAIKSGWSAVRDIANIAFAIAFLMIIYSTATSTGISNYGIKKILPRLVVAAILVNISFYVCAAMVDLSNIIGSGMKGFIDVNMTDKVTVDLNGTKQAIDGLGLITFVPKILTGAISGSITIVAAVVLLALFWSAALIAMVAMFAALALRTFGLVAAIVISPLAFVAYLLPNTEKWFKKWLNEFLRLLFVFPMVMAVWGLSQFLVVVIAAGSSNQVLGDVPLLTALALPIVRALPVLVIIPLFKMSGGMMGKMTSLAQKGTNKLGAPLKKINQEQRERTGQKALGSFRGVATRGLADKKNAMDGAAAALTKAQQEHDTASANTEKAAEYRKLQRRQLTEKGGLKGEDRAKYDQLQSEITAGGGIAAYEAANDVAKTGAKLSNARVAASTTARAYNRQTNGALHRLAFGGATRRAATANMKHENELEGQRALGRRLGEDQRFQRSYSGALSKQFMDQSTADGRVNRALSQAQAIGDKQGSEEREQFKSFLDNVATTEVNGGSISPTRLTNAMAEKLMSEDGYSVKLASGRTLSWDTMTDNEKLTLFQQASGGSTPEVARLRDSVSKFTDPALRQAAANMVIQSGNKDFLVQGANNAMYGTGQQGSHTDQLLRVTQAPLEAGTLDKYTKPASWEASIDGLRGPDGVAEMARGGDAKAQKSLENLAGAIRAQLQQNGAAKVIQAVGTEYKEILNAYNAMPGATTIDVGALFASARSK